MQMEKNKSLQEYNTFGIDVKAKLFATFNSVTELIDLLSHENLRSEKHLILGGGSNLLFTSNFDGVVLKNEINGIELVKEDEEYYYVEAGAGENWHEFVLYCIEKGWAGLENLSLIPGCVGASPMQNIGAYGVEIKDRFEELQALNISTKEVETFRSKDCQFGYRESIFKGTLKNQYIITSVTFRLFKSPQLNTSYGAIEDMLKEMNVTAPTIKDVSDAVISIRSSKLPDPAEIGNSGSFFKNPVITNEQFELLKSEYPEIVSYPAGPDHRKVAAGWLLDHAGWKGYKEQNYGVHKNQALVLVNYGGAEGSKIYELSARIVESIKSKYGIQLEREVNIL